MDDTSKDATSSKPGNEAKDSFAAWTPSMAERFDMIEVAAYYIAERSGFAMSSESCWAAAEEQIKLMFALRESQQKLQTLVDTSLDAVVMADAEGRIVGWNHQASAIFGWSREEILGQPMILTIIPQRYRDAYAQGLKHFLTAGEGPVMNRMTETHALHRDGHEFPVELAISAVMIQGKPEFSAFIRDITDRKRVEAELREMATTDFLTGLANRRYFMARMEDELARLQRLDNLHVAVLMLDLDHFKHVNDSYGHAAGDAVLKHFAVLMQAELRKIDTVGRVGGEEFAIVLPGASPEEAEIFAERLRERVATTSPTFNDVLTPVTVSIGITTMLATDTSADAAMIRADKALYRAKKKGRNRVETQT